MSSRSASPHKKLSRNISKEVGYERLLYQSNQGISGAIQPVVFTDSVVHHNFVDNEKNRDVITLTISMMVSTNI